jgi:hypothetical protein
VVAHLEVVAGHLADGAQGDRVVLPARRHVRVHDVRDAQVHLVQRGVGRPLGLLGLLHLGGQRLGLLQDGGSLLLRRAADRLRGRLLLRAQVVGGLHGRAALGVGGEQPVDQGLVGAPGALAGADEVGVVTDEAQVDHTVMVGGRRRVPGGRCGCRRPGSTRLGGR